MAITADDLRCHNGTPYPDEFKDDRLPDLLSMTNKIDAVHPIKVISGYRSPEYNEFLAGRSQAHQVASGSQHVQGRAVDLRPVTGTAQELYQAILAMVSFGELPELGGTGIYEVSNWVHVDTRPKEPPGHVAKWTGT